MIRTTTLLTVSEVAAHLDISERTVRRWISDGRLTALRVGGHFRIMEKDVDRLVFGPILGGNQFR